MNQMKNKLSSMKRYKTLAVESGQFQNAKKWNEQIKMMEKELENAKQESSNKMEDGTTAWQEAQSKLEKMKSEHEDLEHQLETEKKGILGKAKDELQLIHNSTTFDLLTSVLNFELGGLDQ
ncbi:hypothetical protein K501DRAFT_101511 [Backusella circina FSU 941]|nr:hypothetical protein K501DRAFT_101511 [Backusella circina FSU 941]